MADETLRLSVEADRAAAQRSVKELNAVKNAVMGVSDEASRSEKRAAALGQRIDALAARAAKASREAGELAASLEKTARAQDKLNRAQERFDTTSRNVALAGDAESNLLAVGGLVGSLGGDTGGITAAGDVFATIEALPRLKEAAAGLPQTINAAVATLGPLGVAALAGAGAFVAGAALINESTQEIRDAIDAQIGANRALIQAIVVDQITTDEARQRAERARREQAAAEQELIVLSVARTQGLEAAQQQFGAAAGFLTGVFNTFGSLDEAIADAETRLQTATTTANTYTTAINNNQFAANDAAESERQLAAERQRTIDASQRLTDALVQSAIQLRLGESSLTADDASSRLDAIAQERDLIRQAVQEGGISDDQLRAFQERLAFLEQEETFLRRALPGLEARADALADAEQAERRYNDALKASTATADELAKVQQSTAEETARITEQYANKQQAVVERALEASEKALDDFQSKTAELGKDLSRDLSDAENEARIEAANAERDARRAERDALRDHLRSLRDIREDALQSIEEAEAQGDFARVAELERQLQRDLALEGRNFTEEQSDRAQAEADAAQDQAVAFAQERQQRLLQYQRELTDAQVAYDQQILQLRNNKARELTELQTAQQRELQLVQTTGAAKLAILQQQYAQELSLLRQQGQNRIAAQAAVGASRITPEQIAQLAGVARRADGGYLAAGQISTVNERPGQRESFNGMMLPGGAGLFFPLRGGSVNAGSSTSINFAPVFNITAGGSPAQAQGLVQMIDSRIRTTLTQITGA